MNQYTIPSSITDVQLYRQVKVLSSFVAIVPFEEVEG